MKARVLVIVGPTASGKSALGVRLAKRFNGEVISADSRQVYTGLDIGTGKITKREMSGITHHLLDVASPKKPFSAGDFTKHARKAIEDIAKRGKLPIIVGGTGYYIDALLGRIAIPEVVPNPALRKSLSRKTSAQLFAILKRKDHRRAKMMDSPSESNNKVRLIRAIEVATALGRVPPPPEDHPREDTFWIGVKPELSVLDKKIRLRLSTRIKMGMIAEAKRLRKAGLSYIRMRELGLEYRSLADLLEKKLSKKEFQEVLYREIRRYARKQIGYWKRNGDIGWFDPKQTKQIEAAIRDWLR